MALACRARVASACRANIAVETWENQKRAAPRRDNTPGAARRLSCEVKARTEEIEPMMLCKRIVAIASAGLVCAGSGNPEPVRLLAERQPDPHHH